jgi:hypothetical protein
MEGHARIGCDVDSTAPDVDTVFSVYTVTIGAKDQFHYKESSGIREYY